MTSSFGRLALMFLGVYLLSFAVTAGILRGAGQEPHGVAGPGLRIEILSKSREFSDAAQISGTNRVLIVEDETHDSILSISLAPPGGKDGPPEEIPLPPGFYLKDMEGIAVDTRGFVYVVSSHSLNSEGKPRRGSALARMKFYDGRLAHAETIADLRPWLETEIPEIGAVRNLSADAGGLNIEGLAWDPEGDKLVLGLRGPLFRNHPAVIPIHLKSPDGPFNRQTMEIQPPVILEGITGFGIRSISYDNVTRGFWLVSGGSSKEGKNRFHAWFWKKDGGEILASTLSFKKKIGTWAKSYKLHPEGITAIRLSGGHDFLFVVTDGSPYYFKMDIQPSR